MELITTKICMTYNLGVHGNMFGGAMLAALDESGAILASTLCDSEHMVTVKMDEVVFKRPVKVGQIIRFYGELTAIGTSSVTLDMEARTYNVKSEVEKVVCHTKVTFVRIDKDGESMPISPSIREKYKSLSKYNDKKGL